MRVTYVLSYFWPLPWTTESNVEPTLILIMKIGVGHIDSQPTLNFEEEINMGYIYYIFKKINVDDYFTFVDCCPITNS